MDQVTAVVETVQEGTLRLLTTRYLSECGCEWVVDMWGNVRRVMICERDLNDVRELDQLPLFKKVQGHWEVHDWSDA